MTHEELLRYQQELLRKEQELEQKLKIESRLGAFDELMRLNYDKTVEQFTDVMIYHVAKSVDAVRGAFYVFNDDEQLLNVTAGYACNPKLVAKPTIRIGEDLVGQAAKTREMLYYDDLPTDSVKVQTGLAVIQTRCLIILPLVFNDQLQGAIELGHLSGLDESYKAFLRKLGTNIASTLQSITNNDRTRRLLKVTQEREEELMAQSEELRQNTEELQATHEQINRTQEELEGFRSFIEDSLNSTVHMFIATDKEGLITYWNDSAAKALGWTREEAIGKITPGAFHDVEEVVSEAARLSQELNQKVEPGFGVFTTLPFMGKTYAREWTYIAKDGRRFPVDLSVSSWRKPDGSIGGLLGVATDISEKKAMEQELENTLSVLKEVKEKQEKVMRQTVDMMKSKENALRQQLDEARARATALEDRLKAAGLDAS